MMAWPRPESFSIIIKDQLYLGNLYAAQSLDLRKKLGITHILSVCPEYPSTGPNHMTIAVEDTESEDLLIRLPEACQFIKTALDGGGKVFCHCVMGISRSTTAVCAYLMMTRQLTTSAAMRFVKQRRPQIHPNYGFIKQLDAFAACNYQPSPTNHAYLEWKRKQRFDVRGFLDQIADTTEVIPDKLFMSSDFPEDVEQAQSLLLDLGITHILSISPAQISSAVLTFVSHRHIKLPAFNRDGLLLALPGTCSFIQDASQSGGRVLVHCQVESKACTIVSAYLMYSRKISPGEALSMLEDAHPLFNPTRNFLRHLEIFDACHYAPTSDHPLVQEWNTELTSAKAPSISCVGKGGPAPAGEKSFDFQAFHNTLLRIQDTQL